MSTSPALPTELLTQQQFELMASEWAALVGRQSANEISAAFTDTGGLLTHAAFQADDIIRLASAGGTIRVSFVLWPETNRFGIALFGTNALGQCLTACLASPAITPQLSQETAIAFTPREKEVLVLLCKGCTTQQISNQLFISLRTAEGLRQNLLEKTHTSNTANLAIYAARHGLLDT